MTIEESKPLPPAALEAHLSFTNRLAKISKPSKVKNDLTTNELSAKNSEILKAAKTMTPLTASLIEVVPESPVAEGPLTTRIRRRQKRAIRKARRNAS